MNCPNCDSMVNNEHCAIVPGLPPVVRPDPAAEPAVTWHRVLTWCEFCQMATCTTYRADRVLGLLIRSKIQSFTNAKDVKRIIAQLPNGGRDVRFVSSQATGPGRGRQEAASPGDRVRPAV